MVRFGSCSDLETDATSTRCRLVEFKISSPYKREEKAKKQEQESKRAREQEKKQEQAQDGTERV